MGRIGIYGGTFNPPHMGHVLAAKCASEKLKLDRLLLVPTNLPPHKQLPEGSPTAQQRLELVELATRDIPGGEVSNLEIEKDGVSYTADTIRLLHEKYPDDQLILIMGTDMYRSFPQWYHPEEICRYAELAVLMRSRRDSMEELTETAETIRKEMGGKTCFVENEIFPMSSTDVRRMLAFGASEGTAPQQVLDRILSLGLYGTDRCRKGLSEEELEHEVCRLLNPNRINHVLGCRDTARILARRYGEDETDAVRAALLHDVTKALPPELHVKMMEAYGVPLSRYEGENAKTYHAITGAVAAYYVFGEKERICRAIDSHTTGCENMTVLQKIIYIADYMEPNRDFPGVDLLRKAVEHDLDGAVLMGLKMTVAQLISQGREISKQSESAIHCLEKAMGLAEDK